jgi:hypothetical protein
LPLEIRPVVEAETGNAEKGEIHAVPLRPGGAEGQRDDRSLVEAGSSGHKYAIRVCERIVLTYGVDHAVKEDRVIRLATC